MKKNLDVTKARIAIILCQSLGLSLFRGSTVYSYFEKGCRKKCTRQTRKVLWVVFSSLFFKEISNNGKRGHGRTFASAKGKQ